MYTELGVKCKKTAKRRVGVANVPCHHRMTLPVQSEFLSGTTVLLPAVEKCIESSAQVYVVFFLELGRVLFEPRNAAWCGETALRKVPSCRLAILNSAK